MAEEPLPSREDLSRLIELDIGSRASALHISTPLAFMHAKAFEATPVL
jgi:hypothetical protein